MSASDNSGWPKNISQWCKSEGFSRSTFNGLQVLGRAPEVIEIGGSKRITQQASEKFYRSMAKTPLVGGVRRQAEAIRPPRKRGTAQAEA